MTVSGESQPERAALDNELALDKELARHGTCWVVDFDLAGLLAGLDIEPGRAEDQEALLTAEQEALAECTTPPVEVPGRVADLLPTGPGLAAFLASLDAIRCTEAELPDVAAAFRRLAAWAQARELAAVAEIAAQTAARSGRVDDYGQPAQVQPEAAAEVALALTMSQPAAADWTGLAVRLRWQLPATAAALAAGDIDLARTRLIAEATAPLPDATARDVEARVLPRAGQQTTGQLRAALRRAVIAADPDGADRRREHAERQARVTLYPDADGTATLAGSALPGVRAAAAMARITALATAMKAAGLPGGMDHLRAYVMLGLLLGTLPLAPPAPGARPDDSPPGDSPGPPPRDGEDGHGHEAPADPSGAPGPAASDQLAHPAAFDHQVRPATPDARIGPAMPDASVRPGMPDAPVRPGTPHARIGPAAPDVQVRPAAPDAQVRAATPDAPVRPAAPDAPVRPAAPGTQVRPAMSHYPVDGETASVNWPLLPAGLLAPAMSMSDDKASGRPPPGLLDVIVPWSAFTGTAAEPAVLGRVGPVTPVQASQLIDLATRHPGTQWRVILTDRDGHALAVERLRASRSALPSQTCAGQVRTAPIVGRVTVTIPADTICCRPGDRAGPEGLPRELLRAIDRAMTSACTAGLGSRAVGDCAHVGGTTAYRPSPRQREFVTARDLTCTFPTCRQPAWKADLDHTVPWHRGGPTCACNLGSRCRTHHKIKQLPGWELEQTGVGAFRWTTPAGRTYTAEPHRYPG
jgi:hypothetical protein